MHNRFYFPSTANGMTDSILLLPSGDAIFNGKTFRSFAEAWREHRGEFSPLIAMLEEYDDARAQT